MKMTTQTTFFGEQNSKKYEIRCSRAFAEVKWGWPMGKSIRNIIPMRLAALNLLKPPRTTSQTTFDEKADCLGDLLDFL